MFVVTSPFSAEGQPPASPVPVPNRGAAGLDFECRDGVSRLAHLHQKEPLRVLFPAARAGDPPTAALVTVSGGLVGGDRLAVDCRVGPGAAALVHAQAAEKVYRSTGADVEIGVSLAVDDGGWLEYLPQETILFEGARLRRATRIERRGAGRFLAGEMLVFGRRARGERLSRGLVHEAWEVRRDGRLAWTEAMRLDGDIAAILADSHAFDGAAAVATAVYGGDDAGQALDVARAALMETDGVLSAATLPDGVLVVRWIGKDGLALRSAFGGFWARFRHQMAGLPEALPRLWHI